MDPKERERRMREKAKRRPVNPTVLDVQKGTININDLIRHIDKGLKMEAQNG